MTPCGAPSIETAPLPKSLRAPFFFLFLIENSCSEIEHQMPLDGLLQLLLLDADVALRHGGGRVL
mgnify:CR=1 FL=1